jgi:sulfur carrier protein
MEAATAITLHVNGDSMLVTVQTLAELVAELGHGSATIATAVNGTFIPAVGRATAALSDGDRVEIVSPRQGG